MQVTDQLKTTVRHHLSNWKTLRGHTPFYSEMFWPPKADDVQTTEPRISRFTEFPSIRIHVEEIFTSEHVLKAQEFYPHFAQLMNDMLGIENRVAIRRRRPPRDEMPTPTISDGKMTFDLVKKAFLVEAETRESSEEIWKPLGILKLALKAEQFSHLFGRLEIVTAEGDVYYFNRGERASGQLGGQFLSRARATDVSRVLAKHAIPHGCLKNPHDLSAFAADIASQGYDAVFVSVDGAENGFAVAGVSSIKSIRAMDKYLGGILPVKTLELVKANKRLPGNRVIRPLLKADYGIRVFVAGGEVVAATAQSEAAISRHQTEPFVEEVGYAQSAFETGPYRTKFNESLADSRIFGRLVHKARLVSADLKQVGELHYAMDVLLHEDGSFAIDLHDLVSADYFSLAPSVVAAAIQKKVIDDMAAGLAAADQFSGKELAKLAGTMSRNLNYSFKSQETDEDEADFYQVAVDMQRGRFQEIIENTARMRELLSVNDNANQSMRGADSTILADLLAIPEDRRADYDLDAFMEALRQDFITRATSDVHDLWNAEQILYKVPLLDAATWFKNGDRQTWRYCASNQFGNLVTVRPIDSAPSLSEQDGWVGPGDHRPRMVDECFGSRGDGEIDPFAETEDDQNFMGSLKFELSLKHDVSEDDPVIDFLGSLLEDEG